MCKWIVMLQRFYISTSVFFIFVSSWSRLKKNISRHHGFTCFFAMLVTFIYRVVCLSICLSVHHVGPDRFISTSTGRIYKKFVDMSVFPRWHVLMTWPFRFLLRLQHEPDMCSFEWNGSTGCGWIAVAFGSDIPVSLRNNWNDFQLIKWSLTFSSRAWTKSIFSHEQIFAKLLIFRTASASSVF